MPIDADLTMSLCTHIHIHPWELIGTCVLTHLQQPWKKYFADLRSLNRSTATKNSTWSSALTLILISRDSYSSILLPVSIILYSLGYLLYTEGILMLRYKRLLEKWSKPIRLSIKCLCCVINHDKFQNVLAIHFFFFNLFYESIVHNEFTELVVKSANLN